MPAIRVLLVGENRLFSEGLCKLLSHQTWLLVLPEAYSATCVELIQSQPVDIALVDCGMEGALELVERVPRHGGRPRLIVIAADADDEFAVRALVAGARGVLSMEARSVELLKAIRVVHEGEIWARKSVISRLLGDLLGACRTSESILPLMSTTLSSREREIVAQVAEGLTNKEIADRSAISVATVKAHLTHIFQKLGVHHRVQVAVASQCAGSFMGASKLRTGYRSFD